MKERVTQDVWEIKESQLSYYGEGPPTVPCDEKMK